MELQRIVLLSLAALSCAGFSACERQNESTERGFNKRVAAEHRDDRPTPSLGASVGGGIKSLTMKTVTYATVAGKPVQGYFAYPTDAPAPPPGLIVIHEWWGLNDNIRRMTDNLAAQGYGALAVDLYGGASAELPDRARELMSAASGDRAALEDNLRQARSFLAERSSSKIGVLGWCFGGGWALNTALLMPDKIDALVIYYGHLVQDRAALAALNMPLLGVFAERDQTIPPAQVHQFTSTLVDLGKKPEIHIYPAVDHAFANPSGGRYAPREAADAWEKTLAFLAAHLH